MLLLLPPQNAAAQGTVNALCSTDAGWCEAAATAFTRETGIKVQQAHKGTGEIGAQLRAEAANPKTDIWWGGTGDPFLQAAEQGLLEPYRPAYINDLHDWACGSTRCRRTWWAASTPAPSASASTPTC
jgi:iron(III) transport system substrate-binding protein